ncbi:XTP/dITP diphosphatase [Metabacillus idriensis]|uniref:dITP/XTP pyrophosphatase n=1 Tax=Metabacillus idriensis TaxID=324768 RepID=A0A6I2MIT7_9BACI|nr:XTP/dITP diphosphatase [Metabacillus idriensis]MCM3596441.1 XTP/dITP diphosphatase [Metabacillus idriensis]MRX56976.1 XTP/dITP diphosphatase [Metabacillus idriensis]OHR68396.1 non-canonical purine NTP pyrophosphatase [Bacillus sp. HMSC76G11]
MKDVIIATKNAGKLLEFQSILSQYDLKAISLMDLEDSPEVEETGSTFEENAVLKAEAISKLYGKMAIADDSGLSVDYLGGEPGVYSARYAGAEKSDAANIEKVLLQLKGVSKEERNARFRCALALAEPGRETVTVEGSVEGYITEEPIGENGFGYDPIFLVKDKAKTMAQLTKEEKNKISHRAVALQKLAKLLKA